MFFSFNVHIYLLKCVAFFFLLSLNEDYQGLSLIKDKRKKNATHLSRYIWTLNEKNIGYDLKWRILARANSYSNTNKRCNLCIAEKYFIICKPQLCSLSSRNELVNTCRHARKWCLSNI